MLKRLAAGLAFLGVGWAWWTRPNAGCWSTGSVQQGDSVAQPAGLEVLAADYWSFLRRISLGLIRPRVEPGGVRLMLLGQLELIHLGGPTVQGETIRWPIQYGFLVARPGGYFSLSETPSGSGFKVRVEVKGFRPRLSKLVYYLLQHHLHCWIGNRFLRSL